MSFRRLLCRTFCTSLQQNSSSTNSIKAVCTELYQEGDLKRLVEKFKKASELQRFRTHSGIYADVVRRLASANRFQWIEEILEDQKKYPNISKEGFAARIITLYGNSDLFENAQRMFDEMPDRNCQRTVISFNALLGACVNSKKFNLVDGIFKEIPTKLSIEPDLASYKYVIKAYCEMRSFDSAISMLDEMGNQGVNPDLVTFNILLNGLNVNGRFSDGEKIWSLMEKKNISPDVRSYNAKLYGSALEKTKEAIELFEHMKSKEIKPDVYSFNALIKGFVNEDNLEEAKKWYGEIEKNKYRPVKTTFALLIPFLCEKGDLEFASELCKHIFQRRSLVDSALLQLVVDELVKVSKIEEAEEVVHLAKTNNYRRYDLNLNKIE